MVDGDGDGDGEDGGWGMGVARLGPRYIDTFWAFGLLLVLVS